MYNAGIENDVSRFCDGVAVITLDGETYGVMDETGKMLTSCVFEYARVCSNHTIMASYNRRTGILYFKESWSDLVMTS